MEGLSECRYYQILKSGLDSIHDLPTLNILASSLLAVLAACSAGKRRMSASRGESERQSLGQVLSHANAASSRSVLVRAEDVTSNG